MGCIIIGVAAPFGPKSVELRCAAGSSSVGGIGSTTLLRGLEAAPIHIICDGYRTPADLDAERAARIAPRLRRGRLALDTLSRERENVIRGRLGRRRGSQEATVTLIIAVRVKDVNLDAAAPAWQQASPAVVQREPRDHLMRAVTNQPGAALIEQPADSSLDLESGWLQLPTATLCSARLGEYGATCSGEQLVHANKF